MHVFHDGGLGEHVHLDVYEDTFFDEVAALVEASCGVDSVSSGSVRSFHRILTELADHDSHGQRFKILAAICCPICGAGKLDFRPTSPPRFYKKLVPPLTHKHWSGLGDKERRLAIRRVLGKCSH